MTFADQLINSLARDVGHIFSVPGRTVFPFLRSVSQSPLQDIICASETGAGFMAEGYAKASNKYGVAIIVAGVGFSNIFPSITNAYYDNTKVLFIVGTAEIFHGGRNIFQDSSVHQLNNHNISSALTSYSCLMNTSDHMNHYSNSMFNLKHKSMPVLMNIPIDVQTSKVSELPKVKNVNHSLLNQDALKHIIDTLQKYSILLVVGNRANDAKVAINQFCEKYFIISAATLCAKGIIDEWQDNYLGVFGFGMSPRVFEFMTTTTPEYIITIGMDINERNTYQWSSFTQRIIHIDDEINHNSRDHYLMSDGYISNINILFNELLSTCELEQDLLASLNTRKKYIDNLQTPAIIATPHEDNRLYVDDVLHTVNSFYSKNTSFVTDSGLHRLYCAQILRLAHSSRYYSSVNNGHMGWAIAASIGIKLADHERNCICITGDGCMLMTGTEIQTAAKYKIKVLFIVLNNGAHGAIKNANIQYPQIGLVDHQYDIPHYDWSLFAKSFGVSSLSIKTNQQLYAALEMFRHISEPLLLDIYCNYDSSVNINWYYEEFIRINKNKTE